VTSSAAYSRTSTEVVKQAAEVKARTRPWRAYIASALAIIAAGVSYWFGRGMKTLFQPGALAVTDPDSHPRRWRQTPP
jgi:hypothetical protein